MNVRVRDVVGSLRNKATEAHKDAALARAVKRGTSTSEAIDHEIEQDARTHEHYAAFMVGMAEYLEKATQTP